MRPTTNFTLHAILAAALMAFAATSAAAADAFLKLGDIKGQIEIDSFAWGTTQATKKGKVEYSWKVEAGEKAPPPPGGVQVAASSDVKSPRDAASGLPTGKRQHKPVTFTKPLEKGSMTFRGQLTGCAVGTSYRSATMVTPTNKYEFRDVIITECALPTSSGASSDPVPTESITFVYGKIVTKASTAADRAMWDLKKNVK